MCEKQALLSREPLALSSSQAKGSRGGDKIGSTRKNGRVEREVSSARKAAWIRVAKRREPEWCRRPAKKSQVAEGSGSQGMEHNLAMVVVLMVATQAQVNKNATTLCWCGGGLRATCVLSHSEPQLQRHPHIELKRGRVTLRSHWCDQTR